ncbi:MAG: hypothetical protein HYZ25_18305 [Chloroflexi bacterium]|nr:hypothetical protein [Chloroflexota bacterium]
MPSKKTAQPPTGYEVYYARDLKRTIQRYGADDLVNDIELIRYMNLLTLKRMKAEGKRLTYHDHLETLRAITNSAGKIAHLVEVQHRVFEPLAQLEAAHQAEMEELHRRILEIAALVLGEDKVDDIEFETMCKIVRGEEPPYK